MQTKAFVGVTALFGVVTLGYALSHWHSQDLTRFLCYVAVAILASGFKVQLPGIDGTMSVNFLFILLGVMDLTLAETLIMGCAATLVQSIWQARKRLDPVKILFNVASMMANASALTYISYHWLSARFGSGKPILLMVAALVFFFANTLPISVVIALTEGKSSRNFPAGAAPHLLGLPFVPAISGPPGSGKRARRSRKAARRRDRFTEHANDRGVGAGH
jgi:hypothetical protein